MARPRKRLSPRDLGKVEGMAEGGFSEAQIAAELGLTPYHWRKIKASDPKAAQALEVGRGREESALVGALYKSAMKGNVTAAIFLLKTRHKYIDQPKADPPESRVEVTFQIPAALSPEKYKQVIEVTPKRALKEAGVDAGAA